MSLYAIGDLHLSLNSPKPMDIFGKNWINHTEKIVKNWRDTVKDNDMVLLAGDISWGIDIKDSSKDIELINSLPGKKVIVSGNHDYWFNSASKLKEAFPEIMFLKNNYYSYEDYAVCGTRGWVCPGYEGFSTHDEKIYKREQIRLNLSLNSAINAGYKKIITMLHFPPTSDKKEESEFIRNIRRSGFVKKVIYGHLHGGASFDSSLKGKYYGIDFDLVSADYLDFSLLKIL
ncbi:MAG: metallophosphoesterase [Lachnospiraceae bacterium]|nr:metallophosphoesterase [Lachnospiraceae bacterium]